jgi:DNA-binding MarR family transcriptional regulator
MLPLRLQFVTMGLEKDINQYKFRNEWQKAMINLTYTQNWLSERFKLVLDRFDLTSQQFNILRILRGAGEPLSTLQIRERMLDKMSDTSRIVDRLILKKLVQKSVCPHDKRLVDVIITEAGLKVLASIDELSDEIDGIIQNLSSDEALELNNLLDKLRQNHSN